MQKRERERRIARLFLEIFRNMCTPTCLHLCSCSQEPHRHGELKVRCQSSTHVDLKMIKISKLLEEHRRTPNPSTLGEPIGKVWHVFEGRSRSVQDIQLALSSVFLTCLLQVQCGLSQTSPFAKSFVLGQ